MRAVVLGASGGIGRLFWNTLKSVNINVRGIDVHSDASLFDLEELHVCDATQLDAKAQEIISESDWLICCLPEKVTSKALMAALPLLSSSGLIVDTTSVKRPTMELYNHWKHKVQILSINPMFGPDTGFNGQTVLVVDVNGGEESDKFKNFLVGLGANLCEVAPDEHDRLTAISQVATHSAILTLVSTIMTMGIRVEKLLEISPPPARALLFAAGRVIRNTPETYWGIQNYHPLGESIRQVMIDEMKTLTDSIDQKNPEVFNNLFANALEQFSKIPREYKFEIKKVIAPKSI